MYILKHILYILVAIIFSTSFDCCSFSKKFLWILDLQLQIFDVNPFNPVFFFSLGFSRFSGNKEMKH